MRAPEMLLALILMGSLTLYVLLGGADYGGGVKCKPGTCCRVGRAGSSKGS